MLAAIFDFTSVLSRNNYRNASVKYAYNKTLVLMRNATDPNHIDISDGYYALYIPEGPPCVVEIYDAWDKLIVRMDKPNIYVLSKNGKEGIRCGTSIIRMTTTGRVRFESIQSEEILSTPQKSEVYVLPSDPTSYFALLDKLVSANPTTDKRIMYGLKLSETESALNLFNAMAK